MYFFFLKQVAACCPQNNSRENELQKAEARSLKDNTDWVMMEKGWQHKSGIIKIHIGGNPNLISLQKIKSVVQRIKLRNLSRMQRKRN